MNIRRVEARKEQLLRSIPDVLDYKTLLYVGANTRRMEMVDLFMVKGYKIDVLEIWPQNAIELGEWNRVTKALNEIIIGDIRSFAASRHYDVVMWWHGPEHVKTDELPGILARLETLARKVVVLACPCGLYPQGETGGNPYEVHEQSIYPQNFRDLNYKINILGKTDKPGSNLIGWKRTG